MTVGYTGQLRERVTLQTRGNAPLSAQGDPTYIWADVATGLFARVQPMKAGEATVAERLESDAGYEVTIRWRTGVSNGMRFAWRSRFLSIEGIENRDERRMFLTLICRDLAADAGAT